MMIDGNFKDDPKNSLYVHRKISHLRSDVLSFPSKSGTKNTNQFYAETFILAVSSAVVYWYGAVTAGKAYHDDFPQLKWFFDWLSPMAAVNANTLFNWAAFLELWQKQISLGQSIKDFYSSLSCWNVVLNVLVIFSSLATIAPYIFLGLGKSAVQDAIVWVSGVLNIFVYYKGGFDLVKYFNLPFVQRVRYCYSSTEWEIINKKSQLIEQLTNVWCWFRDASLEERKAFIESFVLTEGNTEDSGGQKDTYSSLNYLLTHRGAPRYSSDIQKFFSCGTWLFGWMLIAQNYGHVVGALQGVMSLLPATMSASFSMLLGVIVAIANLVPGMGYTFLAMQHFHLFELSLQTIFYSRPHVQSVLMKNNFCKISMIIGLLVSRAFCFCSGVSNMQLNQAAAIATGWPQWLAYVLAISSYISGALMFNQMPFEKMLSEVMTKQVSENSNERIDERQQAYFEFELLGIVNELQLSSINTLQDSLKDTSILYSGCDKVYDSFFSKQSKKPIVAEVNQPLLSLSEPAV